MSETETKQTLRDRFRWWLYDRCFAYCVRCVHPDADPALFCVFDMENFISLSKDEVRELIEEAPEIAWHFQYE